MRSCRDRRLNVVCAFLLGVGLGAGCAPTQADAGINAPFPDDSPGAAAEDAGVDVPDAGPCAALRPGLVVRVLGPGRERICDALVTAEDTDGVTETLIPRGGAGECESLGAFDRAGIYSVTASRAELVNATVSGIEVTLDDCGDAIARIVEVSLERAEAPGDGGVVDSGAPDDGGPDADGGAGADAG